MKTYIVDAFTDQPYKGNPAGICFTGTELSEREMLNIAQELGFSETAFITDTNDQSRFRIRFFTPKSEIALCGHATLASGKVMFETTDLTEAHFINIQNLDLVTHRSAGQVMMEFPVYDVVAANAPKELLKALGIQSVENSAYCKETNILMLEIADPRILEALAPDYTALVKSHDGIDGVLVTAAANDGKYDFYSRYFWPWKGTNEDPVTGGSHTFLVKYWSKKLNKKKMRSFQASARTGWMDVELVQNDTKLLITGSAVIVFEGEMRT